MHRRSSRYLVAAVAMGLLLLASAKVEAQQLNAEQREVWAAIQTLHQHWKNGKVREHYQLFHKDYTGWYPDEPFPVTKSQDRTFAKHLVSQRKIHFIYSHPLRIVVKGNMAVAQYYATNMSTKRTDRKDKLAHYQWTDVWVKEGGRWLMLATHGTVYKPK